MPRGRPPDPRVRRGYSSRDPLDRNFSDAEPARGFSDFGEGRKKKNEKKTAEKKIVPQSTVGTRGTVISPIRRKPDVRRLIRNSPTI